MSELDDDTRSLLDQVRGIDDPDVGDRERVRAALAARLGPAAFPSASPASRTGAPPAASGGLAPAFKLLIGLGFAGVLAGGALLLLHRAPPAANAPPPPAAVAVVPAPPLPRPPAAPLPAPLAVAAPLASAATRAPRPSRPAASAPAVADEVAILTRAYSDLEKGDPEQALAELDHHASRFPDGALAEERAAQRVLALCRLGRVQEARADGARFLSRYPASPQAARVRASCGGTSP